MNSIELGNFKAFKNIIDSLGGVDIDVEKDMYIDQVCRDNQIHQKM